MAKQAETGSPTRSMWFDEATQTPVIADHARRLDSFLSAVADGNVNDQELQAQEARLVKNGPLCEASRAFRGRDHV